MCGIVGLISQSDPVARSRLKSCTDRLRHRGPDGCGHWIGNRDLVGLGHRRLAMVDAEHGTQPIFNEDQSVVVVANGEFYGAAKIRMRLEQSGHRFVSNSDSEILPHLYEQYGTTFSSISAVNLRSCSGIKRMLG